LTFHAFRKFNAELMIDVLTKALGDRLLALHKEEGGSTRYPPPNIRVSKRLAPSVTNNYSLPGMKFDHNCIAATQTTASVIYVI